MLIQEFVTDLRTRLSDDSADASSNCWSDAQLLRHIHAGLRSVMIDLTDSDWEFYCATIELYADDAAPVHSGIWLYELPPFTHMVVPDGVRQLTQVGESRKLPIRRANGAVPPSNSLTATWSVDEDGMLKLWSSEACDLIVRISKVPPRPLWGTLDRSAPDGSTIILPAASAVTGGVHVEQDAYLGMKITCSSQPAGNDQAVVGQYRRVIGSQIIESGGEPRVELTVHMPFAGPLIQGAVVESVVQVPEFALENLMNEVVLAAMARRNRPVTDALEASVRASRAQFLKVRHRDESVPRHFAPQEERPHLRYDPDYDYGY